MAEQKILGGPAVRRVRRANGLTQAALAEMLGISPSYLNLIERNQRPLTAALIVGLTQQFDFDPRTLAAAEPGGGVEAMRRRIADPMFADLGLGRADVIEWLSAAPGGADAFARAYDRISQSGDSAAGSEDADPVAPVRREIERWRNHFADLDAAAESLADELRLGAADLYGSITERLRVTHQISIRILPVDVMADGLRRLDLHARQLQFSERLDAASRTFGAAFQLAQIEAKGEIEALVNGAGFADRASERLFRRHLASYFAAALMMPYARFLRACEGTGYDMELLQRRFGAGFEQVAHRLTTLQRVGARGLPFFMLRFDRAGQTSKRYAGASNSPLAMADARCPLWQVHRGFDRPGDMATQLVELEDGTRWFTFASTVRPQGVLMSGGHPEFVVALGVESSVAASLALTRGVDLTGGAAMPVGLGCRNCTRPDCAQRAAPPKGRTLMFNERERGLSPFSFGD
jgi:hypothetical protein